MTRPLSAPNRAPSLAQLITLANRAGRKSLTGAEVLTLKLGIEALGAALAESAIVPDAGALVRSQRLLGVAVELYAGAYGLTSGQAWADVRAEAAR